MVRFSKERFSSKRNKFSGDGGDSSRINPEADILEKCLYIALSGWTSVALFCSLNRGTEGT